MSVLIPSSSAQMAVGMVVLQMHFPSKQGKMSPSAWAQIYSQVCSDAQMLRWGRFGGGVNIWQLEWKLSEFKKEKAHKKPTAIYGRCYMSGQMMFSGYKSVLNLSQDHSYVTWVSQPARHGKNKVIINSFFFLLGLSLPGGTSNPSYSRIVLGGPGGEGVPLLLFCSRCHCNPKFIHSKYT